MTALPYMPLYIADYLADAAHLNTLGHGAYLLLLMTYWQRGEALPDDDGKLARIARLPDDEWLNVRDDVREFFIARDGTLVQKRAERELEDVRVKSEARRNAGIASGAKRGTRGSKRRTAKGVTSAQHVLNICSTHVQQMPNNIDIDTDTEKDKNINPISFASGSTNTGDCHPGLDPGSSGDAADESSLGQCARPIAQDGGGESGSRVKPGMRVLPKSNIRASAQAKRCFADFWVIYPKHTCKLAAEERFYAALRAHVAPQRILDGARRYAESVKGTEAIYVSAPDVWLAKGRYDDEYARPPPPRENLMTRLARGDWETNDGCAAIAKIEYAGPDPGGTTEPADPLAQCAAPDRAGPL